MPTMQALHLGHARSGSLFLSLLAAYFLLHVLIRMSLSDSLALDEAEAVLFFTGLHSGYGTQPPLYAWLQWLVFTLAGVNLFSLALLKNLLLLASHVFMFLLARPMLGVAGAIAVSASLILFPEIGWESHRDRTHSVLLATLACATLWSYFGLLRRPFSGSYAMFGGFIGLGMLSKYNFAVFVAGLAAASLLVVEHRRVVWNRKLWIAAAVALLCFLPHGYWLFGHADAATAGTLQKLREDYGPGYLHNVASGFGSMLVSLLTAILIPALVYGVVCRPVWRHSLLDLRNPDTRLLLWLYAIVLMLVAGLLLTGEVSHMKARWIIPLLASLPLAVFLLLPALQREEIYRGIAAAAAAAAVIVLLGLQLRVYLKPALGSYSAPHYPYAALSEELDRRFSDARLIAGDVRDAGNLRFQQPARRPLILDEVMSQRPVLKGQVLLVLQEDARPGWLALFRRAYPESRLLQQGSIELPYKYGGEETMRFDYALMSTGSE